MIVLLKISLYINSEFILTNINNKLIKSVFCQLVIFFVSINANLCQNLIQNSNFEVYTNCPDNGYEGINLAPPWYSVTNSSVDYYHFCSSSFPVPSRGQNDYQLPLSGSAYAGLWCYSPFIENVREYLQAPLLNNLSIGRTYQVQFYINLCNISQVAVNNIGAYFSNSPISPSGTEYLINLSSYLLKFENRIVNDTLGWTKIVGVYVSFGGEAYITIGNFLDDSNTITEELEGGINGFPAAYYFIDDVSVEEITEPFWQYRDTLVHYGDSVLIGPAITGLDIDWYTADMQFLGNAPGIYVSPETSRSYIAKERFNANETTHTVFVTVLGGAGIIENKLEHVAIYPNPSTASFFVVGKNLHEEITLTLSDLNGKVVHSEQRFFSGQDEKVEFDVKAGVYFLHLKSAGEYEVVRKIVVR